MKTLFDATKIGNMPMKNRFVRAAIADKTQDGSVGGEIIDLYRALAQGGVGTIVTGYALVDEEEKKLPIVALYSDKFLAGHRKLTGAVHEQDVNIIAELVYVGSYITVKGAGGRLALAPSAVSHLVTRTLAREAGADELKAIQAKFAKAALLAKEAGYDGVEIHAAHGFFLSQFMTPYYNRRSDGYGGPAENRSRMLLETYDAIRGAVGKDFPVWVKINSADGIDEGISLDDCRCLCRKLTQRGIHAIEVSGKWFSMPDEARAYFKDAAKSVAEENDVAVILTGGNRSCKEMTALLNETRISYLGIARPFISEPRLINRFREEAESPM